MYQIIMFSNGLKVPMEKLNDLFEACHRADLYKHRNSKAKFWVVNADDDIVYDI